MRKVLSVATLLTLLTLPTLVLAEFATTDSGKRVVLESNGRWFFVESNKIIDNDTVYTDGLVHVSLFKARLVQNKYSKSISMEIILNVEVVSQNKIINPKTHRVYGYEDGSDIGGSIPSGFSITDNFGNDLKVIYVSPEFIGYKERGMRPNETKRFTIKTSDYPIDTATFIKINIRKSVFGNKKSFSLKIPMNKIKKI